MYILNICENPDVLGVIYFILKLIDIVLIAIPIGLIVFITIDVFKMIIGDDKAVKDAQKMVINRLIFAIAIFFIPTIVTLIMNLLTIANINVEYKSCITNATKEKIETFRTMNDIESGNSNGSSSNNSGGNGNHEDEKANENFYNNKLADLADLMLEKAKNELGTEGTGENGNDTPYGTGGAWCAKFVTWVVKNTNASNGTNLYNDIINKDGYIIQEFRALGSIYAFNRSNHLNFYYSKAKKSLAGSKYTEYTPKKGDYIYLERDEKWNGEINRNGMPNGHVGIVEYVEGNIIHTIEGNVTGKGTDCADGKWCVSRMERNIDKGNLIGFGSWY